MDIDWIRYNMDDLSDFLKSRVEHALEVSSLLITTIKRISFSVSPEMLTEVGLNESLRWLCQEFLLLHKVPCHFESDYQDNELTEEIQLDFFRICQESLTNVALHSHARSVRVKLEKLDQRICLSIIDDGIGFDVAAREEKFGLTNMRKRAASINGQFQVQSTADVGTRVTIAVEAAAGKPMLVGK